MKLRFYIDFWNSSIDYQLKTGVIAQTQPPAKAEGLKRVAFDVTIPDEFLYETDLVAAEVSKMDAVP